MKSAVFNRIEEVFIAKEVKNTVAWALLIEDYNGKEVKGSFYEQD